MSNIVVREIHGDDVAQAGEIFFSYKKRMGTFFEVGEQDFNKYMSSDNENIVVYGAFDHGELTGMMQCITWSILPIYSFRGLYTKRSKFSVYKYTEGHPFPYIQDHILKTQEEKGLYTWYYHRQIRPAYHRLTKNKSDLLRLCEYGWDAEKNQYRYNRYVEEIVPKGMTTSIPAHKLQIGNTLFDQKTMIVKACLKQEYRK